MRLIFVFLFFLLSSFFSYAQSISFIQKEYYWIPRIWGQNQETGTYASFPSGGWQWIGDQDPNTIPFTPSAGLQQRALYLPSWFPRKVYISSLVVATNTSSVNTNGDISELACWIDPNGQFFLGGSPHGNEANANFTNAVSLFHMVFSGKDERREYQIVPPILVDRDAGDLIECKAGFAMNIDFIFVGFRYLIKNPYPILP